MAFLLTRPTLELFLIGVISGYQWASSMDG